MLVAVAAAALALCVGSALAARGYSDPAGDTNTAPDLRSVEVVDAGGVLTIRTVVGNFQSLPDNSWMNLWFDVDSNDATGDAGDEALVRYLVSGAVEVFTWNGTTLVEAPADGLTAAFAGGVLTLTVPRTSIAAPGAFDLLVVGSRGQPVGDQQLIASDFVPDTGRASFAGPGPTTFPDAADDQDAAPDVTAVRVSDAKSGWITFAITTPNYVVLPEQSGIVLSIDADNNPRTGESGTEIQLAYAAGEISMERWDGRQFVPDDLPTRARARNAANVVAIDLHTSELDNAPRFRFSVLSADVNAAIQGVVAVDIAPDDFSTWQYTLTNRPALRLVVAGLAATPARPRAGKLFAVSLRVTRSDTRKGITSGSVSCRVRADGKPVRARGSVVRGAGRCSFVVPRTAKGKVVRGTITVSSGGKRATDDFSYVVR